MAITTTQNLGISSPPRCLTCGHEGGLMTRRDDHLLVHFDLCPEGPPPVEEGALIAHDPFADPEYDHTGRAMSPHASLAALERLVRLGHGQTVETPRPVPMEVHEALGSFEPERWVLKPELIRKRMDRERLLPLGQGPVVQPAAGEPQYGSQRRTGVT